MLFRTLLIFIISTCASVAQQKTLRFIDSTGKTTVADADVYTDSVFIGATNYNGYIKVDINGNYKNLIVSHIAYQKRVIPRDSLLVRRLYTLTKNRNVLDEVLISDAIRKDTMAIFHSNFSWGDMAATYIKYENDKYIKNLQFRVINFAGVKGMNYLPFAANLYEYDTITKLPGKPLLDQEIVVENKKGDKWAVADVSQYKIKVPKSGACIIFIIPHKEFVTHDDFVWAKGGRIAIAPTLQGGPVDNDKFSFIYNYYFNGHDYEKKWQLVKRLYYKMKLEFEEL